MTLKASDVGVGDRYAVMQKGQGIYLDLEEVYEFYDDPEDAKRDAQAMNEETDSKRYRAVELEYDDFEGYYPKRTLK